MAIEEITSKILCLEKADNIRTSSSHEEKEALCDEIRALREEANKIRRTNVVSTIGNYPASRTTDKGVVSLGKYAIPSERDHTFSPRISTVDPDDNPCPMPVHYDRSSSRCTGRS